MLLLLWQRQKKIQEPLEAISVETLIALLASVPLVGWIVQMQELLACMSLPSMLFLTNVLFCKDSGSIPRPYAAKEQEKLAQSFLKGFNCSS